MSARNVAVVTGANKGIGFCIVKFLLQRGFNGDVLLTSRNEELGRAAVQKLYEDFNVNAKYHQLDVTDMASIQRLKETLQTTYGGLDVLVNNAGVAYMTSSLPIAEQAEKTFQTNYFGLRNVCDILYPLLRPHARVVHLSSMLGHLSKIKSSELRARYSSPTLTVSELDNLMNEFLAAAATKDDTTSLVHDWGCSSYCVSKVGVTALGFIHQRLFDQDEREDIIVNSVHPGYVNTDLTNHRGHLTPDEGADAPTYAAMLPPNNSSNPKGEYIWNNRAVVKWDAPSMPQ